MRIGVTLPVVYGESSPETVARAAAAGADAVEIFGWEEHGESVADAANEEGVEFGGILAAGAASNIEHPEEPSVANPETHDEAVADLQRSVEGAADLGVKTVITTVGQNIDTVPDDAQHRAIVSVLREVAPVAEEHGVTVVAEPLNTRVDHPGYYLDSSYEAYEIVDAVDSPNVGVLYDVYHQQITEGNLIQNVTEHVEEIGHVHIADVPGRNEPGTGEINYENVLAALDDAGYEGYASCEYFPTGDPDDAVSDTVALTE